MIAAAGAVFLGLFADLAGRNDYAFEPVKTEIKRGDDVVLAVRLIHKRPRKPIANAMIVVIHVDMAPDGMKEITAPLIASPSSEPDDGKRNDVAHGPGVAPHRSISCARDGRFHQYLFFTKSGGE